MKATELMIGDWVRWKNKCVQVASVSGIVWSFGHIDIGLAYCNDDNLIESHDIKSISPIPLTAKILKKNGWKPDNIFMAKKVDENTHFCWTDIYGAALYRNNHYMCDCKDVHTLQHALRLCGLNELADNFKIK